MKYYDGSKADIDFYVAPLAGAWIEILGHLLDNSNTLVAPLAGAWIEIRTTCKRGQSHIAAPLAGAWIEMYNHFELVDEKPSLPSRERGLK